MERERDVAEEQQRVLKQMLFEQQQQVGCVCREGEKGRRKTERESERAREIDR